MDATGPGQQVNLKLGGFAEVFLSDSDSSPRVSGFAPQTPSPEGPYSQDLAPNSLCEAQ